MMIGESRSIEAAATIFGAGASGSRVREAETLATEGNAEACRAAQQSGTESPLCSVPLRLGLLGLNEATFEDYRPNGKQTVDAHGCVRGKQVWNGHTCDDLALDPHGQEIYKSLELTK